MTVQLIDTTSGSHVWSQAYQRELSDIFLLQEEIAQDIVDHIGIALGDEAALLEYDVPAAAIIKTRPPSNLEAYDLYLKGMDMLMSNRPVLIEQAVGFFDRAIALDSEYADAWAAKGLTLLVHATPNNGFTRIPASILPDAIAAFERALEIEPGHAYATGWLGWALMTNDFKWAQGMQLMRQSLVLNPNDADIMSVYGFYMDTLNIEGADAVVEKAYRLNPLAIEPILNSAVLLNRKGRLLDAAAMAETALIGDREGYAANLFSARFNLMLGRLDTAEERLRKARLVAHPVDLTLDTVQWQIDRRRGKSTPTKAEIWERMQTEHWYAAVLHNQWESEDDIVAVFDLAIEQRHTALRSVLFRPKPAMMPEADWRRIRDITGVTQYLSTR